jgi:hypothetical protein
VRPRSLTSGPLRSVLNRERENRGTAGSPASDGGEEAAPEQGEGGEWIGHSPASSPIPVAHRETAIRHHALRLQRRQASGADGFGHSGLDSSTGRAWEHQWVERGSMVALGGDELGRCGLEVEMPKGRAPHWRGGRIPHGLAVVAPVDDWVRGRARGEERRAPEWLK